MENNIESKKPNNPLSAQVWSKLYGNSSLNDQILLLKEIMKNLNISYIRAGDTSMNELNGFDWDFAEKISIASVSAELLVLLGFMHCSVDRHERCKNIVNIIRYVGFVQPTYYPTERLLCKKGDALNTDNAVNAITLILLREPAFIYVEVSKDKHVKFIDVILNDDLYEEFYKCWEGDKYINAHFKARNDNRNVILGEQAQEIQRDDRDFQGIDAAMDELDNIIPDLTQENIASLTADLNAIAGRYRLLIPDERDVNEEDNKEEMEVEQNDD